MNVLGKSFKKHDRFGILAEVRGGGVTAVFKGPGMLFGYFLKLKAMKISWANSRVFLHSQGG